MREPVERGTEEVRLTHPERPLWPRDGIAKADLAAYYEALSGPLLRALAGRPIAFERRPDGIDGESFFQQNLGRGAKPWMASIETPTRDGRTGRRLIVDRPETLRWLAQMNVLTIHMWSSRAGRLDEPDWMVFDLDPADGEGFEQTIEPALALQRALDERSLPSVPKTSGKRGLHVLVPLAPGATHDEAAGFAWALGETVARSLPGVTLERAKAKRRGRLYLDTVQNGWGKTVVAPYSPRAVDGAPVSAPLRWSEVKPGLDPGGFTVRSMPARLREAGDLFAAALEGGAKLPRIGP